MPPDGVALRPARRDDAPDLARLVDLASQGMSSYLWARMAAPGQSALALGAARAARDEGDFSWRNAVIAEASGQVAGGLLTYRIGDVPEPLDDLPAMFRPLQALENLALGSQYVYALATCPAFRRLGVARRLLDEAEEAGAGAARMSLIVADRNRPATTLYAAAGFVERARLPICREDWACESTEWVLLTKAAPTPRPTSVHPVRARKNR